MNTPNCPKCGKPLQKVKQSPNSMLNAEQFDAARAGDWFCASCPGNNRAGTGYHYFWDSDLTAAATAQERTASIDLEQLDNLLCALKPFADAYASEAERVAKFYTPQDLEKYGRAFDRNTITPSVTMGDFRRAFEAHALARRSLTSGAPAELSDDPRMLEMARNALAASDARKADPDGARKSAEAFFHDAAAPSAELTEQEQAALARFDKPEWHAASRIQLRAWLSMEHGHSIRLGAQIENLQDELSAGAAAKTEQDAKLQREVAIMYQMLDDGEWADHIAETPTGQCLETAITKLVGRATAAGAGSAQPEAWMLEFDDERVVTTDPKEVEAWVTQHDNPYTPIPLYRAALDHGAQAATTASTVTDDLMERRRGMMTALSTFLTSGYNMTSDEIADLLLSGAAAGPGSAKQGAPQAQLDESAEFDKLFPPATTDMDCDEYDALVELRRQQWLVWQASAALARAPLPVVRPLDDPKMAEYLRSQPWISAYIETLECELRKARAPLPYDAQPVDDARDAARLDFLIQHEAWVGYNAESTHCRVLHQDADGDIVPLMGSADLNWFVTAREAIDTAMRANDSAAEGDNHG